MLKAKRGGKRKSGVTICAACGRMNSAGLVWRFAVGSEAAASVLATSVYHSLKSSKPSGISDEVAVAAEKQNGRKLLAFPIAGRMRRFFCPLFTAHARSHFAQGFDFGRLEKPSSKRSC